MATAYAEYAGVKLPLWTPQCDADVAAAGVSLDRLQQFALYPDTDSLNGLPLPPRLLAPPPKGGTLWWPTAASQWARAHFLVDTATLASIRSQLVTDAGGANAGYVAADLVLDDGTGGTAITTAMHLLPPLPLCGAEALYLLTLVDERYYWWFRPTVDLSAVTTWSGLYSALGTGIGSSITVDGSLGSFAAPSTRWQTLGGAPLPLLLDSAAWCTGRRVVREFDGTVRATDYATAKAAAAAIRSDWGTTWRRRGGGVSIDTDVRKTAPASVLVRCGSLTQTPTLSGLAIGDYSSVTGKAGYRATLETDAATLTSGQANALATEWYQWLLAHEDTALAGLAAVEPNGWAGATEWTLRRDDCGTRLYPFPLDFGHASGSGDASGSSRLTTANVDGSEESTTSRLEFDPDTGVRVDEGATDGDPDVVSCIDATPTQTGVVSTVAQKFGGFKQFEDGVGVGEGTMDASLATNVPTSFRAAVVDADEAYTHLIAIDPLDTESQAEVTTTVSRNVPAAGAGVTIEALAQEGNNGTVAENQYVSLTQICTVDTATGGVGGDGVATTVYGFLPSNNGYHTALATGMAYCHVGIVGQGTPSQYERGIGSTNYFSLYQDVGEDLSTLGNWRTRADLTVGGVWAHSARRGSTDHRGIDRDFASGEYPIVRGGVVVGYWDGSSGSTSPPPTVPSPPIPTAPTVPAPPPTVSVAFDVKDINNDPVASRSIAVTGATTTPQSTSAGGTVTFTGVPTSPTTTTVTISGSGETVKWVASSQYGSGVSGSGYSFTIRTDLGNVTVDAWIY